MRGRPEGGTHEVRRLPRNLKKVFLDLLLVRPPREVGVGLVEADRAEGAHHGGAREGLGQEERARVLGFDVGEQALPERDGLGMGLSTRKIVTPWWIHSSMTSRTAW